MLNAGSCLEMKKEGSGKLRRRSAGREQLPRNCSRSGPRPVARTFQYRPRSPHVASTSSARGAEPGTPAHTPTAAARRGTLRPGRKFRIKTRAPKRTGLGAELAPGTRPGQTAGQPARVFSRGRGADREEEETTLILTHTQSRTLGSSSSPPGAQVRATQQPHARTWRGEARESAVSAPPRKGPRPPGQLSAQEGCARRRLPARPRRPRRRAHGTRGARRAGRRLARAPPPGPPAGRAGGERRRPRGAARPPARRSREYEQLSPARSRAAPGREGAGARGPAQRGLTFSDVSLFSASAFGPEWPALGKEKTH